MDKSVNPEVGLSISMHDETDETIRAVESFLKFHPDAEVKIWGNEKISLQNVGDYFNLETKDSPQYVNKLMKLLHSSHPNDGEQGAKILREFLVCAYEVYESMRSEFVIYLHPDHLMVDTYKRNILKHDLEIHKVNRYTKVQREAWKNATGKPLKLKSYGLAGYFRRESLMTSLEFLLNEERIELDKLLNIDIDFIFEDLIIPCAFDYLDFSIRDQNLTMELRRKHRMRNLLKKPILIHQMPKINTNLDPAQVI